jgi:anaerobic ribonucleoside-triphosphate reductase
MGEKLKNNKLKAEFELVKHLMPDVINSKLEIVKFKPEAIIDSLLLETDATHAEAVLITLEVIRKIISSNLSTLTAPLIRELVNSTMLTKGFELYRYQYTRLGIPFYDFGKKLNSENVNSDDIYNHLKREYIEVQKLIDKIKKQSTQKGK